MGRKFRWFLLAAAVAATATAGPSAELANDPEVQAMFVDVLIRGGSGVLETESAGFVVVDDPSRYRCIGWPSNGIPRKEVYRGVIPPSTVAIVHTHPKKLFRPSTADVALAGLLGIPVFVVTPMHIYAAMPDGSTVPVVYQRFWSRQERGRCDPELPREGGVAHKGPEP